MSVREGVGAGLRPARGAAEGPVAEPQHRCGAGCATESRRVFALDGHSVWRCPACGLYMLTVGDARADTGLDRTQFEGALRPLRLANYTRILRRLERIRPLEGLKLL